MKSFEFYPKHMSILGGFYPKSWGIGVHLGAAPSEIELEASLGPLAIYVAYYR